MEKSMKTHPHHHAIVTAFALLLAPAASVQAAAQAGGALNGAAGAAAAVQRPNLPPSPPPASARGAINSSATFDAARPARDGVGLNANATEHASVMARERGLTVAALASSGASASLNSRATVEQIRTAAHNNRDLALAEVDTRIDASVRATKQLRREARSLEGNARVDFDASINEVKIREKAVKQGLKAARKAKGEAQAGAQARLADDYTAYAEAVARAEAAAATPATRARPAIPREERASPAIPASPSVNAQGAAKAEGRVTTGPKP
jgi:hypothetical protein